MDEEPSASLRLARAELKSLKNPWMSLNVVSFRPKSVDKNYNKPNATQIAIYAYCIEITHTHYTYITTVIPVLLSSHQVQ